MNKREQDKALDELYAELPELECQGLCHSSCGPIRMTLAEYRRTEEAGVKIPPGSFIEQGPLDCPALTMFKQCGVYQVRPLICRVWGVTPRMRCNYGCRPSRMLSDQEVYGFMARAYDISGERELAAMSRAAADPKHAAMLNEAQEQVDIESEIVIRQLRRRGDPPV